MQFIEQDALAKAVLFKLFLAAQSSDERVRNEEVADLFQISVGLKRISLAFEVLSKQGRIDYFPQTGRASISAAGYDFVEEGLRNGDSFFAQYASSGDDWLAQQTLASAAIPASDRVVTRTDNSDAFEQMQAELQTVVAGLKADNEVGDALGDEREILLAEAQAANDLIGPGRFHLGRLAHLIIPALRFLSDKFAGAAIGEAAKRLVTLILAMF